MTKKQVLNCQLDDGSIDLDKLEQAVKKTKEYKAICELLEPLYLGNYVNGSIKLCIELECTYDESRPQGRRVIELRSVDIEDLLRNKATALKDEIEELGFSVSKVS